MKDQVNLQKEHQSHCLNWRYPIWRNDWFIGQLPIGNYKFLYLSPERLQSDWILDRIKKSSNQLNHYWRGALCIAMGKWFSTRLLEDFNTKKHFPKIPFLALTATATQKSKKISLNWIAGCTRFEKSFARENIAYMVFEVEDKLLESNK
jgi:ATP-dependent DNA helicase RecQ